MGLDEPPNSKQFAFRDFEMGRPRTALSGIQNNRFPLSAEGLIRPLAEKHAGMTEMKQKGTGKN